MTEPSAIDTNDTYQRWLWAAHRPAHARRTAARHAAFFLPRLRPGMRVLDAGCGPGSITVGLAEAVGPDGQATGIDASPDAIEAARGLASDRGCTNVSFECASVYELPFEKATFDAAFAHALLQHLTDPLAALCEIRRVLRPGGVIGIADADHDGSILWPTDPLLEASFVLMREMRLRSGGGDPRVGKRLRSLLHEAGASQVEATIAADCDGTSEATLRAGTWWASYLRAPELHDHAIALGLASAPELDAMASAWERWGASSGAFWARFWCYAAGRVE